MDIPRNLDCLDTREAMHKNIERIRNETHIINIDYIEANEQQKRLQQKYGYKNLIKNSILVFSCHNDNYSITWWDGYSIKEQRFRTRNLISALHKYNTIKDAIIFTFS